MVEGRQYNHFGAFEPHSYTQREFLFSKLHLSLSDRFIIGGYAFNFQPKSPLFADETVCKARAIDTQHADMSYKSDTHHFTWFLDVVYAFLSVSELLWTFFFNLSTFSPKSHFHYKDHNFLFARWKTLKFL